MKKLIAIFTLVALMFSLSLCVFAAGDDPVPVVEIALKGDGIYTATVAVNVGANATLLGFKGTPVDGLKLTGGGYDDGTNIEYIDQISLATGETSTEFEFKFRTPTGAPVQNTTYTFKIGGSNGVVYTGTYIEGAGSTGYTLSGTVSNVAPYYIFDGEPTDYDEIAYEAFKTTVTLQKTDYEGDLIATIDIDPSSKSYSVSDLEAGTYFLTIARQGYITRYLRFELADDKDIGDTELIPGDIDQSWYADGTDVTIIFKRLWTNAWNDDDELVEDPNSVDTYIYAADFNYDTYINGTDVTILFENLWSDWESYAGATDSFDE